MGTIANLFGYVLNFLYVYLQNFGWAIILFSVILQLILLPLSIKQQKSMKKSAKVQSQMQKLHTSLLEKYTQEITESGESSSYPEIKIIEKKANEDENVYINMNFLGLDLSKVPMQNFKDIKVLIVPLLYVITTFINIRITTNMNKTKEQREKEKEEKKKEKELSANAKDEETMDEQLESMQQMTNSMNYMMPIMSVAIAIIAPLGLSLYWLVKNILQLIERALISKIFMKDEKKEA